ncbi:MAG: hypothetical protein JNM00_02440, partial [Flavobacteriales bacterium]|nr:hypothetical protein [Flavobacteriales bacterium]
MSRLFQQKTLLVIGAAVLIVFLTSAFYTSSPVPYHSEAEKGILREMMNGQLPIGSNAMFTGSGKCGGCHGHDILENANLTSEGVDVNPTDNWRGTMMANSAKDPFWRAKVSHEVAINPEHQEALEDKCTSCHAPLGRYNAHFLGYDHYPMDSLEVDSLALDGVSCGACHQQRPDEMLGKQFSGVLNYSPDTIWGPYVSEEQDFPIFSSAMADFVGYMPIGTHKMYESEMCAACHTLQTHSVDLEGEFTGTDFVEQATYHEWVNSAFNDGLAAQECQGCHFPRLPEDEEIVIASGYAFLPGRSPFGQHWMVGGNSFMLNLMKNNIDLLGLTATEDHFQTAIDRTLDQLHTQTATLELSELDVDGDTARYRVRLTNLAGHKFPSGYPARRAYIEVTMTDAEGNVIWQSGGLQPDYEVAGQDPEWEPHYQTITDQEQVQIYEMVMGDVNGDVTTVLERAYETIKDNRLAPLGFSTSHYAYDTTAIVGDALTDTDFNHLDGVEGSGTDDIYYHIPVSGVDGAVTVSARLMYQSVPPKWNQEMFSVSTPEIELFESLYLDAGATPVEIDAAEVDSYLVAIPHHLAPGWHLLNTGNGEVQFWSGESVQTV